MRVKAMFQQEGRWRILYQAMIGERTASRRRPACSSHLIPALKTSQLNFNDTLKGEGPDAMGTLCRTRPRWTTSTTCKTLGGTGENSGILNYGLRRYRPRL